MELWCRVNSFRAISNSAIPKSKTKKEGRGPLHIKKKEKADVGTDVMDGDENRNQEIL